MNNSIAALFCEKIPTVKIVHNHIFSELLVIVYLTEMYPLAKFQLHMPRVLELQPYKVATAESLFVQQV